MTPWDAGTSDVVAMNTNNRNLLGRRLAFGSLLALLRCVIIAGIRCELGWSASITVDGICRIYVSMRLLVGRKEPGDCLQIAYRYILL